MLKWVKNMQKKQKNKEKLHNLLRESKKNYTFAP